MVEDSINDISIVLCGAAGQGIQTVESLLTKSLKRSGYNVLLLENTCQEYAGELIQHQFEFLLTL